MIFNNINDQRKGSEELVTEKDNSLKSQKAKKNSSKIDLSPIKEKIQSKTTEKKQTKPKQATLEKFNIKIQQATPEDQSFPELSKGTNISLYSYNVNGLRATLNKGTLVDFIKRGKLFK